MKKFFLFAASALMLMACAKTEELSVNKVKDVDPGITFSVYAQRSLATRGGGQTGDLTNANIGANGFGVFAYYTMNEKYDPNAKPNFMYNQQVTKSATGDKWVYEPVKYWPNEYGNAAISDEVDYVSFFAYAPYTEFEPTTGEVIPDSSKDLEKEQKFNIISVNKNNATGDPIIKYVVDTDPATSVDLLWGVAANSAQASYSAINDPAFEPKPGLPFLDLVKPGNPKEDKIDFNLKHSLAKVKFTIDYIADDFTPNGTSAVINADETRIFVRSFTISGWATRGALNLNNTTAGEPLWKDYDGVKDLAFNDVTFHDGRKENKEGDVNGAQTNEENQGLNPLIIENYAAQNAGKYGADKNPGVTNEPQLLFGGDDSKNDGYFYVIPRNDKTGSEQVDVTIVYDVETIDPKLAGTIADGSHGLSTENVIYKRAILGPNLDFEAGKQYLIKIHLGMTSVKIDAVVTEWVPANEHDVDLPDNQPMPCWTVKDVPGYFLTDPTEGIEVPAVFAVDEDSFKDALKAGPFQRYYEWCDMIEYESVPYALAGADRYNSAEDKTDMQSGLGIMTAPQWEAAGYKRCWKGALIDASLKSSLSAKFPQFGIDLGAYVLPAGSDAKCTIAYNGADEITIFDGDWYAGKVGRGEYFCIGSLPGELNIADLAFDANGDAAEAFDASKFVVKYYYPSDKVEYHETIY
jgi:hypothetical protein